MMLMFLLLQTTIFVITLGLFIVDYKKKKIISKQWLWWSIIPIFLSWINAFWWFIPFYYFYSFYSFCFFCLVQLVVFVVYLIKRGKSPKKMVLYDIPATCPHCKNPNTKKTQVCEWCGNDIC